MESNDKLEQLLKQMYAKETLHDETIDTKDIIDEEWVKFEADHFKGGQGKVKSKKVSFLKIAAKEDISKVAVWKHLSHIITSIKKHFNPSSL